MPNGFVVIVLVQQPITGMLIGRDERKLAVYGPTHEAIKCRRVRAFNQLANDVAFTSNRANNRNLLTSSAATLATPGNVFVLTTPATMRSCLQDFSVFTGTSSSDFSVHK